MNKKAYWHLSSFSSCAPCVWRMSCWETVHLLSGHASSSSQYRQLWPHQFSDENCHQHHHRRHHHHHHPSPSYAWPLPSVCWVYGPSHASVPIQTLQDHNGLSLPQPLSSPSSSCQSGWVWELWELGLARRRCVWACAHQSQCQQRGCWSRSLLHPCCRGWRVQRCRWTWKSGAALGLSAHGWWGTVWRFAWSKAVYIHREKDSHRNNFLSGNLYAKREWERERFRHIINQPINQIHLPPEINAEEWLIAHEDLSSIFFTIYPKQTQ